MRLGVMGDWSEPYLTLQPRYEAEQLRAFAQIIRNGHLYKGYKPVHWCLDCRSALAEAEVEYEERTSPSIDVRFEVVDRADLARRCGLAVLPDRPRERRDLDHDALDAACQPGGRAAPRVRLLAARRRSRPRAHELLVLASELAESVLERAGVTQLRASWPASRAPRSRASRCATRSTTAKCR